VNPTTNGSPLSGGRPGQLGTNGERSAATGTLPEPVRTDRWQPLRLGLLNVFRFDDEVLHFERGRLLLRGNNGTGKSRILAMTLPFLLDGELAPHRLEPDQDQAKRPEWNLLLGRHEDRVGYTWIEFGRLVDGQPEYLTLACGMRAVKGRGIADRWYLTTDLRIGRDLALVAEAGQPLTRGRLEEAVGDRGTVHETATRYRSDVDRRVFGLGEHRYAALVDLLIQLRRPQLSRQLDPSELSGALSEALPPVPQDVLDDVAEAFRTLETDREELTSYRAAAEATSAFLGAYRRYAGIAVRRRARSVTSAHAIYESTQRDLRAAERGRAEAAERIGELDQQLATTTDEERRSAEQVRTLESSPAMDRARELEHARQDAERQAIAADEAREQAEAAAVRLAEHDERVVDAEAATGRTREATDQAAGRAREAAAAAALADELARTLAALDLPDARDAASRRVARGELDGALDRRGRALRHLLDLDAARDRAARQLHDARTRLDVASAGLDAARDDEREALAARERAVTEAVDAYRRWSAEVGELYPAAPDDVAWELESWHPGDEGRSPIARAVDEAVTAARTQLTEAGADLRQRRERIEEERAALAAERDRVLTTRHLPPPAPHTRDAAGRELRAGAPLWQLVDPVEGLDAQQAAGFEAALEAAGLLDAWVTPDGQVLDADEHDVVLMASGEPAPGGGLGTVLRPAPDRAEASRSGGAAAVQDEVIRAVLDRIGAGVGQGDVWVTADGRFQVGPLVGAWSKPSAEHLGQTARDAARQRRLAALDEQLATIDRELGALAEEAEELRARAARLEDEVTAAPGDTAIRDAESQRAAASRRVAGLREDVAGREGEVVQGRTSLGASTAALAEAAADLGLDAHLGDLTEGGPGGPDAGDGSVRDGSARDRSVRDRLEALRDALTDLRTTLAGLWPTLEAHASQLAVLDRTVADRDRASEDRRRLHARAEETHGRAVAASARRDTLQQAVGAEVEEILRQLEEARGRLTDAHRRLEELRGAREEARIAHGVADARIGDLTSALAVDDERRGDAIAHLAAAVGAGLLRVADETLDELADDVPERWSADRTVRTARRIDQVLADVDADDGAWSRSQQTIIGRFSDLERELLARDLRPAGDLVDDLFVVTTAFQGEQHSMPGLREFLDAEVTHRQALLSAREKEILENHLVGDVAALLHALLRAGEEWVAEVNRELAAMPTSTGMRLRFSWQPDPDGPTGLKEARRRLLAHHAGWSPEQRAEVGAFLQEQIALARDADDAGTWLQHLSDALDYRRWHRFVVERYQDGEWKPLTRRTHGTGSGGEKALALTVPQFAAAAAHYRSAAEDAPRLIMLDEAFVGIDSDMRAKCMGLLEQFDLDLVMTSEREWGCYPTVPGIAIAQLATREGIDAVGVSRWIWNGRERLRADDPAVASASGRA
jgi:hypothetical protein